MDRDTAWFRRLLRLLPADFQADYGTDMERTFRAQRNDAERSGAAALLRLWAETLADFARTAPREHADQLSQDVVYAVRTLRSRPAATLAAVATLGVGIGAVTAIVSIVSGVDWRPLGYPDADRLVFVEEVVKGAPIETTGYATFADWHERTTAFEALAAVGSTELTLVHGRGADRVAGLRVSSDYFRASGLPPAIGRPFTAAEQRWENRRFVILSARLWRNRFDGDPAIVGRAIRLDGIGYVVTGVMPEGVEDVLRDRLYDRADVWLPLAYDETRPFACRTCRHLRVIGRLRRTVAVAQAEAQVDSVTRVLAREHPTAYAGAGARVKPIGDALLGPVRPALYVLLCASAVLLLMSAVNISNLLLVRAVERGPEIATRRALGIATGRLVRQLMTESLVLAAAGGMVGVALAAAAVRALVAVAPPSIPRLDRVSLDGTALLATTAITGGVGVLFGLLPAWHLVRTDLTSFLRGGRSLAPGGGRAGRALVAVNVAMAVVLLAITALLGRSFIELLRVDPGFGSRGVITASIALAGAAYRGPAASQAFARELLARVAGPDDEAALTTQLPTAPNDSAGFHIVGRTLANPGEAPSADRFGVTPAYFRALRIPLLRGRTFDEHDGDGAPLVAVINRAAAERLFAGEDPIGRRIVLGGPTGAPRAIVGIVGDVRHHGLSSPVTFQAYVPLAQFAGGPLRLVLRTADGEAEAAERIRGAIASIDRSQVAYGIRSFDAVVADTLAERRFLLSLIGAFTAAALLLATIGLYGIVAYVVVQRRRDLGLRMALGAARRDIRRLVFRIGMGPVAAGLALGSLLVAVAAPGIRALLYAVGPFDAVAMAAAATALAASALVACYIPARRATRLDPAAALRSD